MRKNKKGLDNLFVLRLIICMASYTMRWLTKRTVSPRYYRPRIFRVPSSSLKLSRATPNVRWPVLPNTKMVSRIAIKAVGNIISLDRQRIIKSLQSLRILSNQSLPMTIDAFSVSRRMASVLKQVLPPIADSYMRNLNKVIETFSNDEWTVFLWRLGEILEDPDWMEDISAVSASLFDVYKEWIDSFGMTDTETDWRWLLGAKDEIQKSVAVTQEELLEGLAKIAEGTGEMAQEYKDVLPRVKILAPGEIETWLTDTQSASGFLGQLYYKYLESDDSLFGRIRGAAATGLVDVDTAMARLGVGKTSRVLMMAFGVGLGGAGIAWGVSAGAVPLFSKIKAGIIATPALLSTKAVPLMHWTGTMIAGTVAKIVSMQALKTFVAGMSLKTLGRSAITYFGSVVFAGFILEESVQTLGFASYQIGNYAPDVVKKITKEMRETLEARKIAYVPVYGTIWSLSKYFKAASTYADALDLKANIQIAKKKKKKAYPKK